MAAFIAIGAISLRRTDSLVGRYIRDAEHRVANLKANGRAAVRFFGWLITAVGIAAIVTTFATLAG